MELKQMSQRKWGEPCEKCGTTLDMYYVVWCPGCEPPKPEKIVSINLIKSLRYLELHGREGIRDRVMDFLEPSNDTSVSLFPIPEDEKDEYEEGLYEDILAIRNLAGVTGDEELYVDISW
jgi:hypothetical protein